MQKGSHEEDVVPIVSRKGLALREGGIIQEKGWRRSCMCTRILKV